MHGEAQQDAYRDGAGEGRHHGHHARIRQQAAREQKVFGYQTNQRGRGRGPIQRKNIQKGQFYYYFFTTTISNAVTIIYKQHALSNSDKKLLISFYWR